MRLLKRTSDDSHELVEFVGSGTPIPRYAILSHTWGADHEEITYQDLDSGTFIKKAGYRKIQFCSDQASKDGLEYFWIDTCCIDKRSSAELSEAINSMFVWYRNTAKCYVYLSDVSICMDDKPDPAWMTAFRNSRWFTRGWTIQELVAPASVEFYSVEGRRLGDKLSMVQELHNITNMSEEALKGTPLQKLSVEERMSWIKKRNTKREEDMAYSLLGIFGVYMTLIYGEGKDNAFARMNKKIREISQKELKHEREPFSTVPFAPDDDFVDRPEMLEWVQEKCNQPGSRAALVGLGGVGKSQLAIRHAHSVRKRSPLTYVFWVHASTRARFEEAYRGIAHKLDLQGRHDTEMDTMQLVHDWLCIESNGKWTMIIDNVDDVDTFFSSPEGQKSLSTYLPQSCNGSILVTSRSKDAAARLTGGYNRIKEVLPMDEVQGLRLLRNKLQDPPEEESAIELLKALGCMPLIICQAAAYINRRAHMTTARYLEDFRTSSKKRESLLNWEADDLRRDESSSNSVVVTWQMSFERVRQERPSAADLLSLMSCFNPQGIPEAVLQRYSKKQGNNRVKGQANDDDNAEREFDDDIDLLRAYHLVATTEEPGMYGIHALVQFCTRLWLASCGTKDQWESEFIELMAQEFPHSLYDNWEHCQKLLPHIEPLFESEPEGEKTFTAWAKVLANVACYLYTQASYRPGKELTAKLASVRETKLGQDHDETLQSWELLAMMLLALGDHNEAVELLQKVLEIRVRTQGQDDVQTLNCVTSLAKVLENQGKYKEAEKLHRRVIPLQEKLLGPDHERTLTSVSNLSIALQDQGHYEEAEKLCRRVLAGSKNDSKVQQIEQLRAKSVLGIVLRSQGKANEAEGILREVVEQRKMKLGERHPSTFTSINNLAMTLMDQEKYTEAEALAREVVGGVKKAHFICVSKRG
ncbi:hypothetical protein GQ44DRAFT_59406 [Phaeosphaeriaceae sp. PMI808]|nr:hypothetical protein GQ44DRAFT_59406 [Phaeosphaeriaceae sp. PMI808]